VKFVENSVQRALDKGHRITNPRPIAQCSPPIYQSKNLVTMKITQLLFLICFLTTSLTAQKNGNGQLGTKAIQLADFSEIHVNFPVTAKIDCGTTTALSMTTDDNLFDHIRVEVEDDILYIQQKGWVEATKVALTIGAPNLKRLQADGYGLYTVKNIDADEFRVTNNVGLVKLFGKANTLRFGIETGTIDALELVAQEVYASIWSHGKAKVNAVQLLDGKVENGGEVIYTNQPAKNRIKIKGESEVVSADEAKVATQKVDYIDFKLFNNSGKRIQAYVKGPKGKRFSYGFPLNPLQKRREHWPVGSKVYKVGKLGTRTLLATIEADNADNIVKLFD